MFKNVFKSKTTEYNEFQIREVRVEFKIIKIIPLKYYGMQINAIKSD